ncbi:MAG: glycosyltransferase family 2 protein [Actinomycetia bacterium]|nr:glycosyltransferase family 2 protein [Actinomycetes bacterium]
MTAIDVVIVAHNAGDLIERAVASVVDDPLVRSVCIVDNASTDGAPEAVAAAHPRVRVLRAENRGFAAGNNLGISAGDAPYVMLLNPDAEMNPGSLALLHSFASEHSRAGIVGPEILNANGTRQAGSRGRFPTFARVLALHAARVWARITGAVSPLPKSVTGPTRVDWVTGAAMLVRRAAIEAVGGLDEGFFLYYEDVDWCHRMHDAGWEVWVVPGATVTHHLGQAGVSSAFAAEKYREAFWRYCEKYRLHGLKLAARLGLLVRRSAGGRP